MQKKTTMTDIAKALGVSQTLVSFVLSGKNDMGISDETKKKVLMTAEKMGYCPGAAMKMLKFGRSGNIAVVFTHDPGNALGDIIGGINGAIADLGYSLIIYGDPKGLTDIKGLRSFAGSGKADGFILFGKDSETEAILSGNGIPYYVLTNDAGHPHADSTGGQPREYSSKCAGKLCDDILSIGAGEKKKKTASKTGKKKARSDNKGKETAAASQQHADRAKKNESIWLL